MSDPDQIITTPSRVRKPSGFAGARWSASVATMASKLGDDDGATVRPSKKIRINFGTLDDIQKVPDIGIKLAKKIISIRLSAGNITPAMLKAAFVGRVTEAMLAVLDFQENPELWNFDRQLVATTHTEKSKSACDVNVKHDKRSYASSDISEHEEEDAIPPHSRKLDAYRNVRKAKEVRRRRVVEAESWSSDEEMLEDSKLRRGRNKVCSDDQYNAQKGRRNIKRRPRSNDGSSSCYEEELEHSRKWRPTDIPKLQYDGKGNFEAFELQFRNFVKVYNCSDAECLYVLSQCLRGKAAEYYALLDKRDEHLSFRVLMTKLETRFGVKELTETAEARFQQAYQSKGEDIEDWADRVQTLAKRAYKFLPGKFADKQAVNKFCSGLRDKELARSACMERHSTLEDAIQYVKWFQHCDQTVFGRSRSGRSRRHRDMEGYSDDEDLHVYQADTSKENITRSEMQEMLTAAVQNMAISAVNPVPASARGGRGPFSDNSSRRYTGRGGRGVTQDNAGCFHCGSSSHFKRECPELTKQLQCFRCGETGHIQRFCNVVCLKCHQKGHIQKVCPQNLVAQPTSDLNRRGTGVRVEPVPKRK